MLQRNLSNEKFYWDWNVCARQSTKWQFLFIMWTPINYVFYKNYLILSHIILTFFQWMRCFRLGALLISWRNCPLINSHWVICWNCMPNCRQVRVSSGYSLGRWAWSTVGNRWCRVWSPNTISVRGLYPLTSTRSRVASRVCRPQSRSSLSQQSHIQFHSTNMRFSI